MRRRKSQQWVETPLAEGTKEESKSENISRSSSQASFKAPRDKFEARESLLELKSFSESKSEYKGFFTLFWVGLFVYMLSTITHNWRTIGGPLSLRFFIHFTEDILTLAIADIAMVGFTFVAPLIQKAVVRGLISLQFSVYVKHFFQTCLIFGSIAFIINRNWPWVQSGSFLMHTIVMFMKMHSYLSTNYDLHLFYETGVEDPNQGIETVKYPRNVSFSDYIFFLLVPTLVYETSYPRTDRVRFSYLLEKAVFAILSMFLLYITIEHHIHPILWDSKNLPAYESIIQLLLPFLLCYIMVFFVIFECICNWFAEVTRFADREFYSDWWNSTSFDEFARKWNKPVHQFLLRHIYHESIKSYKFSKHSATFITFLFSSLLHELILAVTGRKILMYMFVLQMIQIPLIYLSRTKQFRSHPLAGNILFWGGMTLGLPLLSVLYCRQHFLSQ